MSLEALQESIGYTFDNTALLEQALTHSSCNHKNAPEHGDNERLEFLGDRVLNFTVADMVFHKFGHEDEGRLSKRHAALVRQESLCRVAETLNLGQYIRLGKGESTSGGREKPTILSDTVEALIAAIYLDSGLTEAQQFIHTHWENELDKVELKDPKSRLQEVVQAKGHGLPVYSLEETKGEAHARVFVFKVEAAGLGEATGAGTSKQTAQREAARALLRRATQKEDN